jgi:hypothetical protein
LYASSYVVSDQIKGNEMGGTCNTHGKMRNAYKIFIGKPEGKRPRGRPKHKWEDIRMDLRKWGIRCGLDASGLG